MKLAGFLFTILGCLLIALSFVWTILFPAENRWTPEQAEEHARAGTHFHKIALGGHVEAKGGSHSPGKAAPKPNKAQLDEARERWLESKANLTAAQTEGKQSALWLRYSGVAIALAGVASLSLAKKGAKRRIPSKAAP